MAETPQHKPTAIALIPIKERTRGVLIKMIDEWKLPYPDGIGEHLDIFLVEFVTGLDKSLETISYKGFMLLFQVIESDYRIKRRRTMLAAKKDGVAA